MENNNYLIINSDYFDDIKVELEEFLYSTTGLNNRNSI